MDLEVVGCHALLFDNDAMAAFANSGEALVDWNSLSIDRYDVRHLLPGPLPPRLKRRPLHNLDASSALEADLDHDRYLDLPSSSYDEQEEQDNGSDPVDSGGYHAIAFSYGNPNACTETKNNDIESGFRPHFSVPESLLHNLPPNEKVHQIIARTALFVSKHGGQSEIVLRVKQGDNPTFGFLMPDHHLHAYFRFLVDHQELLEAHIDDGNSSVDKKRRQGFDQTGGALSLLGSVYGSGEDEDATSENTHEFKRSEFEQAVDPVNASASLGIEQAEFSSDASKKDEDISKNPISSLKEKVSVIKRNHSISTVNAATAARTRKGDALNSVPNVVDKLQTFVPTTAKIELPVVEPPSDLKRVIEKVVEFISKNGKNFEAVLAEQDRAHGRFPFLLPYNHYHPYYLKVLQTAQESKLPGKRFLLHKHDPVGHAGDNNSAVHREGDNVSFGSIGSDLQSDVDRKEKFKMVVGKSKKDGREPTSKDNQPQNTVSMDAAAAAAILQAATRGIKNPNLEIFTKTSSGNGQFPGSDGARSSSSWSLYSSQSQGFVQKLNLNAEASASVPVAKVIAETLAAVAAGEGESSEARMTQEQKLKAKRLKRAKMFAAVIKSGAAPLKSEPLRGLSVEPSGSGISGSDTEPGNHAGKERERSSVPFDVDNSDESQKSEERLLVDNSDKGGKSEEKLSVDRDERQSKRRYRSRASRHEEEGEEDGEEEEGNIEDKRDHKRSRKKHRSHRSSHSSRDMHKHKRRHSSSKDKDSAKETLHDSCSGDEHQHSRHHHKYHSSSDEKHHSSQRRHRKNSMIDNEDKHSRRQHKHYSSSDDEHWHRSRNVKHKSRSYAEKETDPEEGEIIMKSDHSKASEGGRVSREASVELSNKSYHRAREPSQPPETTDVSDELRAKIRAMLMATL